MRAAVPCVAGAAPTDLDLRPRSTRFSRLRALLVLLRVATRGRVVLGDRRESNPRVPAPQAGALPLGNDHRGIRDRSTCRALGSALGGADPPCRRAPTLPSRCTTARNRARPRSAGARCRDALALRIRAGRECDHNERSASRSAIRRRASRRDGASNGASASSERVKRACGRARDWSASARLALALRQALGALRRGADDAAVGVASGNRARRRLAPRAHSQ